MIRPTPLGDRWPRARPRGLALLTTLLIRAIIRALCRVNAEELAKIPKHGPLILIVNHINFLEVPLLYTHLFPRDVIGLIKKETLAIPFLAYLARSWGAIPLDRSGTDLQAMRSALRVLEEGGILAIAPEGTRSGDGQLRPGHGGLIQLGLRSGAVIIPIAHYGGERFWKNLRSLRRTSFRLKVGRPFRIRPAPPSEMTKSRRERTTASAMRQLARLLPPKQRGPYATPDEADDIKLLEFL